MILSDATRAAGPAGYLEDLNIRTTLSLLAACAFLAGCAEDAIQELSEAHCAVVLGLVQAGGDNDSIPFWSADRLICPLDGDTFIAARNREDTRCLAILQETASPELFLEGDTFSRDGDAYLVLRADGEFRLEFETAMVTRVMPDGREESLACRYRPQRDVLWLY